MLHLCQQTSISADIEIDSEFIRWLALLTSHYDTKPTVAIHGFDEQAWQGYPAIADRIQRSLEDTRKGIVTVETYPAVRVAEIVEGLRKALDISKVVYAEDASLPTDKVNSMVERYLTDDRVFGRMAPFEPDELFDDGRLAELRKEIDHVECGVVLVIGFCASLVTRGDILVYADLARWEIQLRYRSGEFCNWKAENYDEDTLRKFKRGYFFEWRVADRLKRQLLPEICLYLDTNVKNEPKMVTGAALRGGLQQTSGRPFRMVPYFDPGIWGGHWLESHIDLPLQHHPYAWGFDGVPEENSLYFLYGDVCIELPAINLVFAAPKQLLGERVYARFGAEFPIRFDFLDTMDGQNLSLQVHPTTDYIQQTFGMHYTQDESYYILDAKPGAKVYLGLREGVDPEQLMGDLRRAEDGQIPFPVGQYVNTFPAEKHDHFLIPAGTVHCSGRDCVVLEISATPYIFTFKLWDWDRLGLDGRPRPVHLLHGFKNLRWDRTTTWVESELISQVDPVAEGDGWREERTGLHEFEFIETRRHWFSNPVLHATGGSVNVLNLVEGDEATVVSPTDAFHPFVVHYAETFIIPAAVGEYVVRPSGPSVGRTIATIKAYVR
jgi:mannose-6-phosphate isomerase class I